MDNHQILHGEDDGILRRREGKEEELFVFGYSCNVYEDYDKSLYVDQGKHLIPWLGDESLKIDRYDCRGALNDLTPYLPKSGGFDRFLGLSAEEKRMESYCEQERYRALVVNEDEELMYQEEELKRLQKALNSEKTYSEVPFAYEGDSKPTSETSTKNFVEHDEDQFEHFIPPYTLDIPVGMKIPKSKKHHEIIEKTAFFICEQGAQMEILLKMKQADNRQFDFLSYDNDLHSYYRHMMKAIKNGQYTQSTQTADEKDSVTKDSKLRSEIAYLHPSLTPSQTVSNSSASAPIVPVINYKPSTDCTYSALVNRIKETQNANRDLTLFGSAIKTSALGSANERRSGSLSSTDSNDDTKHSPALPFGGLSKSARRRRARKEKEKEKNRAAVSSYKIYYSDEKTENKDCRQDVSEDTSEQNFESSPQGSSLLKPIPAPSSVLEIPSPDVQLIIDKMALYVIKNGRDFEAVVKAKGDPRFSFLEEKHVYYPFYCQKVELYSQLESAPFSSAKAMQTLKPDTDSPLRQMCLKITKSSRLIKPIPICFSIKKPKEGELPARSALPYEESEGEDGGYTQDANTNQSLELSEEFSNNAFMDNYIQGILSPKLQKPDVVDIPSSVFKTSDMMLEKWAQERLVAKLVTTAKEKLATKDRDRLGAADRDKILQAERRKKAADFINLLRKKRFNNQTKTSDIDVENVLDEKKESSSDVITILSDSASESDSVVSVPLNSCDKTETEVGSNKRKNQSPEQLGLQNIGKDTQKDFGNYTGDTKSKRYCDYSVS